MADLADVRTDLGETAEIVRGDQLQTYGISRGTNRRNTESSPGNARSPAPGNLGKGFELVSRLIPTRKEEELSPG
jgi:hypothetical protein